MQQANPGSERTLTELDFARLKKLGGGRPPAAFAGDLEVAELVPAQQVPPDVVTMYSQVEVVDLHSRARHTLTLCYPADAEPARGFISVLSPVGASLLGLRVGDVAHWRTPHGEPCAAEVVALLFQPEASGDYST
jgi:regulator of nucleoside diphosphate kinase